MRMNYGILVQNSRSVGHEKKNEWKVGARVPACLRDSCAVQVVSQEIEQKGIKDTEGRNRSPFGMHSR